MAKKIELLHTTYDESGNIESQEVVHPLTSPDCIIMENGKTLDEVMGDGIATPTLTHEGTSFKVGVGDSNIEVVDGDVAGMTLKGQSYQNILPKPTTLIMETDEKEFKINDKIDSNIIIDDNIAEIATVKGKTIVNAVQEESGSEYTVLGEDLSGQSIVTTNKSEGNIKGVTLQGQTLVNTIQEPCKDDYVVLGVDDGNLAYDTIIKPSTLYTVRFKRNIVNADNPLTVDLGGTTQTVTSTEFTITTPSTLTHNQLVFSGKNNVVSEVQVIEGDVVGTQYPFFEGMNDVQITDMIRNVNLFDMNDTVPGYLGGTGTEIKVPDHGNLTSNYIKVKPNTAYVYNHGGFVPDFAEYWTGMYFYQDDRGTESNLYTGGTHNRFVYTGQGKQYTNFKFTTPADCEYIRIGSRGLSHDGAWATLYQLDNFSDSQFIGRGKNLLHVGKGYSTTSDYNGLTVIRNEAEQTITINGTCTLDNTSCALAPFYREFKKGERYASSCKLISGTADKILFRVNDQGWKGNIACGIKATSSNIYETCIKTFYSDETYDRSSIRVDNGATFNNAVFKVMLEKIPTEGTFIYTPQYEPCKYVEVQQDVDSIPLTSDMFEQGVRTRSMGMSLQQCPLTSNTTRISSKTLIPVKPNSKYTVLGINTSINHIWGDMYDKDGLVCYDSVLDLTGGISSGTGVFVPHDVHYLCIKIKNTDESAITPSILDSMNLILQEVPQEIVLRGIGDVKDELDLTRGEYIQRIGEIVLDGSKGSWAISTGTEVANDVTTLVHCYNAFKNAKPSDTTNTTSVVSLTTCDKYESKNIYGARHIQEGVTIHVNSKNADCTVFIRIKAKLTTTAEVLNYFSNNPFKMQYELATPIIHKVNLTNTKVIPSYATETHYETITPSDSLIPNITIPSTLNYDVAIKPSTEYTIRANTSDNLTVDLGGATGTLSNGKVTLTTPNTLTHNEVKFSGTGKVKELMVVEGSEIKDNVPFFNGMKDVQMGGIKLVNIARGATCNNLITANTNKTQFTYTSDGTKWGDVLFDKSLLKQNTLYTIYINVISSNSDNANPLKISMGDDLNTWLNVSSTGLFKQTFTTNDNISNLFGINFRPCTSGQKVVIQNPMIIEGDWTHLDEIPFIESEMIIDQPIIRSQGENLLDLETKYFNPSNVTYTKGGVTYTVTGNTSNYNYGQFAWTTADSWFRKLLGKEVTLSVSSISCTNANSKACIQVRMECTNGLKVFKTISINDSIKYITFTIPSNAIDMALQLMSNNTGSPLDSESTLTVSNIQLVLGNTAASYEPYKHQTLYSNRVIGYEEGCYYVHDTGAKASSQSISSVTSDVEGLSIAYVTHASSNFSFWNKDGAFISGSMFLSTANDFDKDGFIVVPANAKYMKMACGNQNSSAAKDYHLKATVTGELPLRSLPNGVCDTLNLVTGEYVQRVGEIVLNGSEVWGLNNTNSKTTCYHLTKGHNSQLLSNMKFNTNSMLCNRYPQITQGAPNLSDNEGIFALSSYDAIYINSNIMSTSGSNDFKQYLSQNPITVQYELETPIVRKLEFTTKGNYRQANLATDCEWGASPTMANNTFTTRYITKNASSLPIVYNTHLFSNDFPVRYFNVDAHQDYEYISNMEYSQYVNVRRDKLEADTIEAFSKWIQQNPIEIGYITWKQSSESYSNIHKPIFFNNVNVQFLPYNLDIQPQLTFQARTRNSYVMDMMKPNTTYTMKCLAYSNSAKLYVANSSANTSVSSNKTLQFAQSHLDGSKNGLVLVGQWYEPMIIEGDVTGKNLPYFKGILSSYHDVDEVELYSVNKNLFDMSKVEPYLSSCWNTTIKGDKVISVRGTNIEVGQFGAYIKLDVRPNSTYTLYIEMEKDGKPYNGRIYGYENDDLWGNGTFTGYANTPYHISTSHNAKYITIGFNYGKDFPIGTKLVTKNMRLYLGEESPVYIPHAHSTTLIEMPTRLETVKVVRPVIENGSLNQTTGANYDDGDALVKNVRTKDYLPVQPGEIIKFYNNGQGRAVNINYYDINKQIVKYEFYDGTSTRPTVPKDCYFVRMYCGKSACSDITLTRQAYKPIQLNSLPNGVRDEIIMKPNSNKAQLVQRVGKVVLDGSENWSLQTDFAQQYNTVGYSVIVENGFNMNGKDNNIISETYTPCNQNYLHTIDGEGITIGYGRCYIRSNVCETSANTITFKNYLQQNPITVYYELATPIIHEIQLKGYPHVYENGTVTLNTDTPHQTLVSYNVNQEQLINTQNETIIRHDQQIDDLYYYIELYLEEIYQMELFRMKLELSL